MTPRQQKYLEEFERFKDVPLESGLYQLKSSHHKYEIIEIREDAVSLKAMAGHIVTKTPHWCRKNLFRIESNDTE